MMTYAKYMAETVKALEETTLPPDTRELVMPRASQINGMCWRNPPPDLIIGEQLQLVLLDRRNGRLTFGNPSLPASGTGSATSAHCPGSPRMGSTRR